MWPAVTARAMLRLMSTMIVPAAPVSTEDAKRYANGIAEIRQRLGIARTAVARIRETRNQDLVSTETIFLQMRKVCELIAFGSLIANKELYSQHYETFAEDWRLGRVVDAGKLSVGVGGGAATHLCRAGLRACDGGRPG